MFQLKAAHHNAPLYRGSKVLSSLFGAGGSGKDSVLNLVHCPGHYALCIRRAHGDGVIVTVLDAVPQNAHLSTALQHQYKGFLSSDRDALSIPGVISSYFPSEGHVVDVGFHPALSPLLFHVVFESGRIAMWTWDARSVSWTEVVISPSPMVSLGSASSTSSSTTAKSKGGDGTKVLACGVTALADRVLVYQETPRPKNSDNSDGTSTTPSDKDHDTTRSTTTTTTTATSTRPGVTCISRIMRLVTMKRARVEGVSELPPKAMSPASSPKVPSKGSSISGSGASGILASSRPSTGATGPGYSGQINNEESQYVCVLEEGKRQTSLSPREHSNDSSSTSNTSTREQTRIPRRIVATRDGLWLHMPAPDNTVLYWVTSLDTILTLTQGGCSIPGDREVLTRKLQGTRSRAPPTNIRNHAKVPLAVAGITEHNVTGEVLALGLDGSIILCKPESTTDRAVARLTGRPLCQLSKFVHPSTATTTTSGTPPPHTLSFQFVVWRHFVVLLTGFALRFYDVQHGHFLQEISLPAHAVVAHRRTLFTSQGPTGDMAGLWDPEALTVITPPALGDHLTSLAKRESTVATTNTTSNTNTSTTIGKGAGGVGAGVVSTKDPLALQAAAQEAKDWGHYRFYGKFLLELMVASRDRPDKAREIARALIPLLQNPALLLALMPTPLHPSFYRDIIKPFLQAYQGDIESLQRQGQQGNVNTTTATTATTTMTTTSTDSESDRARHAAVHDALRAAFRLYTELNVSVVSDFEYLAQLMHAAPGIPSTLAASSPDQDHGTKGGTGDDDGTGDGGGSGSGDGSGYTAPPVHYTGIVDERPIGSMYYVGSTFEEMQVSARAALDPVVVELLSVHFPEPFLSFLESLSCLRLFTRGELPANDQANSSTNSSSGNTDSVRRDILCNLPFTERRFLLHALLRTGTSASESGGGGGGSSGHAGTGLAGGGGGVNEALDSFPGVTATSSLTALANAALTSSTGVSSNAMNGSVSVSGNGSGSGANVSDIVATSLVPLFDILCILLYRLAPQALFGFVQRVHDALYLESSPVLTWTDLAEEIEISRVSHQQRSHFARALAVLPRFPPIATPKGAQQGGGEEEDEEAVPSYTITDAHLDAVIALSVESGVPDFALRALLESGRQDKALAFVSRLGGVDDPDQFELFDSILTYAHERRDMALWQEVWKILPPSYAMQDVAAIFQHISESQLPAKNMGGGSSIMQQVSAARQAHDVSVDYIFVSDRPSTGDTDTCDRGDTGDGQPLTMGQLREALLHTVRRQ